ncbi:MAG: S9 family peptidase, partial [Halobacteriales archaeon]
MATYDIERYLNIRSAWGASLGPDGERLAFLLDTTGVPQVWTLDAPRAWPEQRTFYDERVTFVDWSPERDELAFGMDAGGNERVQFFRLDLRDGSIHPLTGTPEAKHRWGGWSGDGERVAFASNRRDEAVFDVYVQERTATGDDAELVHEGDGWLSVAGWSPDDGRLLVHEARASFDHDLHVLDLQSGELTRVTDDEGDVRYVSPQWGPDGDGVYCCTDVGSDTLYLVRIELADGARSVVSEGGAWNVDGVTIDADTARLVYSRNVDGRTELTVGELVGPTEVAKMPSPDLPDGVAGGVDFGPAGERYAVTATGRSMNPNVYLVAFASGETERWTAAPTAGIPRETFRAPELVRYESFDGLEVPALFTPPERSDSDAVPVVVDVHGGPESQRRPSFAAVQQYLLHRGYAVFEPNVRGSAGYGREYTHLDDVRNRLDAVADLDAAVDWLADHPAIDADRVACMGGSYGGYMVLAALTEYPDRWAAGVDIVGIANFVTFLENTGDWRRHLREAEYGSLADDREFLEAISPINNVDRIEAPLFVLHGANDPRVPV